MNRIFAVLCAETAGLYSFNKGDQRLSQKLMRGRVVAQGFTILVLFAGVTMTAKRPDVSNEKEKQAVQRVRSCFPLGWSSLFSKLATGETTTTAARSDTCACAYVCSLSVGFSMQTRRRIRKSFLM